MFAKISNTEKKQRIRNVKIAASKGKIPIVGHKIIAGDLTNAVI
jgi:hypothetical protein